MKKTALAALLLLSSTAWSYSIVGKWQTVDDKTNKPRAIVVIEERNGEYFGTIESLAEGVENKCKGCEGDKKDTPVIGVTILKGLKKDGENSYSGGHIFDPATGKTYKSKAKLVDDGQKLDARGYIGISLIGRTQTWLRVE